MRIEDQRKLWRAKYFPDEFVAEIVYEDAKGQRTLRRISPIKFTGAGPARRCFALCLAREDVREFLLTQILEVELIPSSNVLMPEAIAKIPRKFPE